MRTPPYPSVESEYTNDDTTSFAINWMLSVHVPDMEGIFFDNLLHAVMHVWPPVVASTYPFDVLSAA